MAGRPSILPLIDTTTSNVIDWASSPLRFSGFQLGQVVVAAPHNTMGLLNALWSGYLDYGTVRAGDYLDTSTQRWSATQLAYTLGQEVVTIGAAVDTLATYFVDGYRIEIDQGLLQPFGAFPLLQPGATLPGRIWLYLDTGIIADPGQPVAAIRVELAGVGAAAAPGAGEFPLVGVDVDAVGKVTANVYDGSEPAHGLSFGTIPQTWTGGVTFAAPVTLGDTLELGGTVDGAGFSIVDVDAYTGESLTVSNTVSCNDLTTVAGITCGGALGAASVTATGNVGGATLSSSGLATLGSATVTGTLTANDAVNVNGTMSVIGGSGGALTSDLTAPLTWNGTLTANGTLSSTFRTRISSTSSIAAGDLSVDVSNNLRWRDATATKFAHVNASGWVKGHGQADSLGAPAATLTLDTAVAVAPLATSNLDVEASCWVSRAIAGAVTISLDEVGVGQIGASSIINVPATAAGAFTPIVFSRTKAAASTTPRIYRLTVAGGGPNVTVSNARITVTPTA